MLRAFYEKAYSVFTSGKAPKGASPSSGSSSMRLNGASKSLAATFDGIRADYNAAKVNRYRRSRPGLLPLGSGADFHYRSEGDFFRILELARDFDRNDLVVGQGVNRVCQNVLQDGFTLNPQTGDDRLDRDLRDRFQEWAHTPEECESSGRYTFNNIANFALRDTIVDGDTFILLLRDGRLQYLEAHRARSPRSGRENMVHGVELSSTRRPLRYWFTREDLAPHRQISSQDLTPRPARDRRGNPAVLHCFNADRFSQTRGVSSFARIVDPIGMHDDLQFAKLVQAQVVSCFAILSEKEIGVQQETKRKKFGAQTTVADGDFTRIEEQIAPGMRYSGQPGEKLTGFSPNVPNPEFFQHSTLILTFIAVNLNLPLAVLLLDPSNTNFSGWRGAMDQAKFGFRRLQCMVRDRVFKPVYRFKVRQWLSEDVRLAQSAARRKIRVERHDWEPPTWPYIEPVKETTANLLQQRNGLNSPRRIQAERGRSWEDVSAEIVEDNALAIESAMERAKKINEKAGREVVHWRELLSLPTPDGVSVTLGATSSSTAPSASAEQEDEQ